MSNTKHHSNSKAFKRFWVIIFTLAVIAVAFMFIRNQIGTDEATIQTEYLTYVAKHEMLKAIADDAIHEGKGVDITVFTNEDVMYKIYNNDDQTILVHYWLDEKVGNDLPFFAKILLSSDYQILEEDFSSAEEYESFKWKYQLKESLIILLYALGAFFAFYIVICLCYGFISLTSWVFKLFKREKRVVVVTEDDDSEDEAEQNDA